MLPPHSHTCHKSLSSKAAPTGQGNRILRKDNKHLPRDGKGFKDNGDNTATLGSDGKTVNVDIDATPNTTGYSETRTTKSTVYKENNNNDLYITAKHRHSWKLQSNNLWNGRYYIYVSAYMVGQYLNNDKWLNIITHFIGRPILALTLL